MNGPRPRSVPSSPAACTAATSVVKRPSATATSTMSPRSLATVKVAVVSSGGPPARLARTVIVLMPSGRLVVSSASLAFSVPPDTASYGAAHSVWNGAPLMRKSTVVNAS